MVRTYKRTSNRAAWSAEAMRMAISTIISKELSIRQASVKYGIPRATLQKRLKARDVEVGQMSMGRFKLVFSEVMEIDLKEKALQMEMLFYGLSGFYFRRLSYDFAETNNINHPFDRQKRLAGKDWMISFLRRHHLSLRTPQPTSINRVAAFDPDKVSPFYDQLKKICVDNKLECCQIFNVDETGVTSVPESGKIVTLAGKKIIGKMASGEKGRTVTLVVTAGADGRSKESVKRSRKEQVEIKASNSSVQYKKTSRPSKQNENKCKKGADKYIKNKRVHMPKQLFTTQSNAGKQSDNFISCAVYCIWIYLY
jgi:hypothetical protein